jgi:hypothetical protein
MSVRIGSGLVTVPKSWTDLKSVLNTKGLSLQYETNSDVYDIFCIDNAIVYTTIIYTGTVPPGAGVDQSTNDLNKSDFETNYKPFANRSLVAPTLLEAVDHAGTIVAATAASLLALVPVMATTYTEPLIESRMELISSSAQDNGPSGNGARRVKITFFDGSMVGPFAEEITLGGTNVRATIAQNIRFVEKIEVLKVGPNGTNVGIITLRVAGAGPTIGTIAVGAGMTLWGHHYVSVNNACRVTDIVGSMTLTNGMILLRRRNPLITDSFEKQMLASIRVGSSSSLFRFDNLYVIGPARITAYAFPDIISVGNMAIVGFGFRDV